MVEILVASGTMTLLCQLLLNIFNIVIYSCLVVIDFISDAVVVSFIDALQPEPLSKSVNCKNKKNR